MERSTECGVSDGVPAQLWLEKRWPKTTQEHTGAGGGLGWAVGVREPEWMVWGKMTFSAEGRPSAMSQTRSHLGAVWLEC